MSPQPARPTPKTTPSAEDINAIVLVLPPSTPRTTVIEKQESSGQQPLRQMIGQRRRHFAVNRLGPRQRRNQRIGGQGPDPVPVRPLPRRLGREHLVLG